MTKGFKKFNDIMLLIDKEPHKEVSYNITESLDFINRYCSNLNLDGGINELCKHVCQKIEEYDLVSENTPTSKASGSIYLVSYLFNLIYLRRIFLICVKLQMLQLQNVLENY